MESVVSADGTRIAFERTGEGPPLVLVHGSTADHTRWPSVLPELNRHFTVLAVDRRGRGQSGDADPYSIEQEYDDIAAVVVAAGADVSLLGHSFGALCAMEAALRVNNLHRLVLYEPVFPVGGSPLYAPDLPARLRAILELRDREAFLVCFFREAAGVPDEGIEALKRDPSWQARLAAAHTALRELADGEYRFGAERFRALHVPTLLLVGENSPIELTAPARALDEALPQSRLVVLKGQGHVAMNTAPEIFLSAVMEFLRTR
jgi:pimeloyl-ACP methyl ester carboxylesterase